MFLLSWLLRPNWWMMVMSVSGRGRSPGVDVTGMWPSDQPPSQPGTVRQSHSSQVINRTEDLRYEVSISLLSVLCLHLLYKPKSWGSAKILKNVDNYEWVTCSERWGQAPEVSIIVHGHCAILIKSRYYWYLKLELKMHPVPNTSWIGKNNFLLKKNSRIEMPNRFEDNHLCWNKARRSPAF